jgi:hypothetical protein
MKHEADEGLRETSGTRRKAKNMSESAASAHLGTYLDAPPLSPAAAANGLRVTQPAEEQLPTPAPPTAQVSPTSPEALLLRYNLMTSEQMAQALGERIVTGKDVATIALEKGWITQDDLAQVQAYAAPVPVPVPVPAPVPEPAPVAPTALPPAPETVVQAHVAPVALFIRLANGERIAAGTFASQELAMNEGRLLALRMGHEGEWPFLEGRYIRPEAVVSIDVESIAL